MFALGRSSGKLNVLHLPVRGGVYTTAADLRLRWTTFFAGRIVPPEWVADMVRPRSDDPEREKRYGLGFCLHESTDTVILEGMDTGVSFRSLHDSHADLTHTVISNDADGAWPLTYFLAERREA